jgi:cell wall-associated NlpC family hydrolase
VSSRAEGIVARARALVGVRFRAQGRCAAGGVDCIGLAAAALELDGVRQDYALRGGCGARLAEELRLAGLAPVSAAEAGDLLVMQAGPGQLHLGIWTGAGLIHADAGLKRVVERPGSPPWPVAEVWRVESNPSTIAGADGPPSHAAGPHWED